MNGRLLPGDTAAADNEENAMQWLADNWIVVLLVGGMAAMHLFGHGGHGGHGGAGRGGGHRHGRPDDDNAETEAETSDRATPREPGAPAAAPGQGHESHGSDPGRGTRIPEVPKRSERQ